MIFSNGCASCLIFVLHSHFEGLRTNCLSSAPCKYIRCTSSVQLSIESCVAQASIISKSAQSYFFFQSATSFLLVPMFRMQVEVIPSNYSFCCLVLYLSLIFHTFRNAIVYCACIYFCSFFFSVTNCVDNLL